MAFAQKLNNKTTDPKKNNEMLIGYCDRDGFASVNCSFDSAFKAEYPLFHADEATMKQLAGKLPADGILGNNLRVAVFAIWCVYLNNNLFVEPSNAIFVNSVPFLFAGLIDGLYTRSMQANVVSQAVKMSGLASQPTMRIMSGHV